MADSTERIGSKLEVGPDQVILEEGIKIHRGGSSLSVWKDEEGKVDHYSLELRPTVPDASIEILKYLLNNHRSGTLGCLQTIDNTGFYANFSETGLELRNRAKPLFIFTPGSQMCDAESLGENLSGDGVWRASGKNQLGSRLILKDSYAFETRALLLSPNVGGLRLELYFILGVSVSSPSFQAIDGQMRYYLGRDLTEDYHLRTIVNPYIRLE